MDRLTTLMERFALQVKPAALPAATLVVIADHEGVAAQVWFGRPGLGAGLDAGRVVFAAEVDWGGASNPLLAALPDRFGYPLSADPETASLVNIMCQEFEAARCGSASVVNRLGEVLIVRLLRAQIEAGSTEPGLLAGLSEPRLSRAIVAIHESPGRPWRNDDLAEIAGLSLSRFSETFLTIVGETPAAYLRRWRLVLARQDLQKGDRVDAVARRYGYDSAEGFARAFKRSYGLNPLAMRSLGSRDRGEERAA
ncbi:AraC family transcriptional regulator [Hoeflea sp. YIM 152468]|uniref:AraC family transcriptional regulator n=1 Tax=Hoeflea sp. YIM 152468 TaxID=3031759 RepID=UPI0023D99B0B|nr:AraC family transcriptional regulator [Hoeflea sp. YIM 152468]MDF1609775.1 AraC family transcriptional regulator [Hoeflea sp. YIM 152468]